MQFKTNKAGAQLNPNGSPCSPYNHPERCEVALCVFNAVRDAGAPVVVQLAAGDAAYCYKSHLGIELAMANSGGTPEQSAAASLAFSEEQCRLAALLPPPLVRRFDPLPVAWEWWHMAMSFNYGNYIELDNFVKNTKSLY